MDTVVLTFSDGHSHCSRHRPRDLQFYGVLLLTIAHAHRDCMFDLHRRCVVNTRLVQERRDAPRLVLYRACVHLGLGLLLAHRIRVVPRQHRARLESRKSYRRVLYHLFVHRLCVCLLYLHLLVVLQTHQASRQECIASLIKSKLFF